jgi:hypothetical protein
VPRRMGRDVMYFPKRAIAVLAVSMSVAAQTPQQHGQAYLCERKSKYENLFPRPVVFELQSTPLQTGIDLTKVISPPEFRHGLNIADKTLVNLQPPVTPSEPCQLIRLGQIH